MTSDRPEHGLSHEDGSDEDGSDEDVSDEDVSDEDVTEAGGAEQPERPPPKAPMGGHMATWPFAVAFGVAASLVAAVIAVNVFAGGGTTGSRQQGTGLSASGAVACPEYFETVPPKDTSVLPWVPAKPAGVHSRKKMVPKLHPTHVTICRYAASSATAAKVLKLSGDRELTGTLDRVVDTLRALPAAPRHGSFSCFETRSDTYLIGMRYAEAIVWVSAPGNMCISGNGSFVSDHDPVDIAAASYTARQWVSSP